MFTRPSHLSDATVALAVGDGWGLHAKSIEYVPLGFGSYHWRATADGEEWFITVDDLASKRRYRVEPLADPLRRLSAALSTAHTLADAGMDFVVAPRRTVGEAIVHVVEDRFAIALYPFIDGDAHPWGPYPTRRERFAVLDRIATLHSAPPSLWSAALVDDLAIPARDSLLAALDDLDSRWDTGPFGESARGLLDQHAADVVDVLDRYDRLTSVVGRRADRMVLTHGEPHRGNTITCSQSVLLIDWDTALIAAPERDLWALIDEDPEIVHGYHNRTGSMPDADALECYRTWWDLTEIAIYVGLFREPHDEDEDTRASFSGLAHYLDHTRR